MGGEIFLKQYIVALGVLYTLYPYLLLILLGGHVTVTFFKVQHEKSGFFEGRHLMALDTMLD